MKSFVYNHIELITWLNCFCETYISYFPIIYDYLYNIVF